MTAPGRGQPTGPGRRSRVHQRAGAAHPGRGSRRPGGAGRAGLTRRPGRECQLSPAYECSPLMQDADHDRVEEQAPEPDQLDVGGPAAAPARGRAGMQVAGVHHPGDEGPGLGGVPAPVPAPGLVRPDRAGDDAERPDREREHHGPVGRAGRSPPRPGRMRKIAADAAGQARGRRAGRAGRRAGTPPRAGPPRRTRRSPGSSRSRGWRASTTAAPAAAGRPGCR